MEQVRVMVFKEITNRSVYDTGNEAISNAGQVRNNDILAKLLMS